VYYKIPKRTGEIPYVIGGSSQLLVESLRPLGLEKGKLLENWGKGLDKQASRTLLYNYLPVHPGDSEEGLNRRGARNLMRIHMGEVLEETQAIWTRTEQLKTQASL